MKTHIAACSAALLFAACGCTSPQSVTRSQSPHQGPVNVIPAGFGNLAAIQHPAQDAHAYSSSYHSTSGYPGYDQYMSCPSGPCGPDGCGTACGCGNGCGQGCHHNYHSYAYTRPHDLVYPPPQSPGGAIVYPYYTHKGPSDFFRDDPKRNY
ncbi:MAG: hypothetical protein AB7I48_26515 [Planctomycetaceae bacterium]